MTDELSPSLLRVFLSIAEIGTFTGAADRAGLSPSAVKHRVARLEQIVGGHIFDRRSGGRAVALTRLGTVLLPIARDLIQRHDDGLDQLVDVNARRTVSFGSTEDHAAHVLPGLLSRAKIADRIELRTGMTSEMRHEVPRRFDLVLAVQAADDVGGQVIGREPLVWVGHRERKLDSPLRLALYPDECLYHQAATEALYRAGRPFDVGITTHSRATIDKTVAWGDAISVLPYSTVKEPYFDIGPSERLPPLPALSVAMYHLRHADTRTLSLASELTRFFKETQAAPLDHE